MNIICIILMILAILLLICLIYLLICSFIHNKIFGSRCDPNEIIKYYEASDYNLNKKPFQAKYNKKEYLRGFYYYNDNTNYDKIIVISHGMWGNHQAYMQEIGYFVTNNYFVLGFDYYGTNLSDGKNICGLGNSLKCLDKAISQVKIDYPNIDIYVFGHSWGGYAASNILKYHGDIKKVVALSGFISIKRITKTLLPKKVFIFRPGLLFIDFIHCHKYSLAKSNKTLANSKSNVLIVHSKDDNMVNFDYHTKYLMDNLQNENIKYLILENRKHNPDYSLDAINYMSQVYTKLNSLNESDKKEYLKTVDFKKMGVLDLDIMNQILAFYNN